MHGFNSKLICSPWGALFCCRTERHLLVVNIKEKLVSTCMPEGNMLRKVKMTLRFKFLSFSSAS